MKLKGPQEIMFLDANLSSLKGKIITGALLHIRSASPRTDPFARVGVSSVAAEWAEGKGRGYQTEKGGSSFSHALYGKQEWAYPGSSVLDVIFGRGNTLWRFAECSPPDGEGWQTCAMEPDIVAARLAGLSHGFSLYDEVGSVWAIEKGRFKFTYFPNRFCYSRESKESAPWMEVWTQDTDSTPPEAVRALEEVSLEGLREGEVLLKWKTPRDHGGGKTLGFQATYRLNGQDKVVPRYLVPMAGEAGAEVTMHLQDLPVPPGKTITLTINAVDNAGNVSSPYSQEVRVAPAAPVPAIPENDLQPFPPDPNLLRVGGLKVAVVDLLDKIDPVTGSMIPPRKDGYKGGNHLFSASRRLIRMQGGRNEALCFQLNLEGQAKDVRVDFSFAEGKMKTRVYQFGYVSGKQARNGQGSYFPDPLILLRGSFSIPSNAGEVRIPNQKNHSLICEIYTPHEEPSGSQKWKAENHGRGRIGRDRNRSHGLEFYLAQQTFVCSRNERLRNETALLRTGVLPPCP